MSWFGAAEIQPWFQGGIFLAIALGILLVEGLGYWAFRPPRKVKFSVHRRLVPWGLGDLALIAAVFYLGVIVCAGLWQFLVPAAAKTTPNPWIESRAPDHPLLLLMEQKQWNGLLVCGISAVLVAPLAEEFIFRVFLQGWLESLEWRGLRRWRSLRRWFPRGVLPVLFSATPFALMHLRAPGPQPAGEQLQFLMAGNALVWLIALAFALFWMRVVRGATPADLGWAPEKCFHDLRLGFFIFIALIVPMYCLQAAAHFILPKDVTPDPLPLFVLAAVLGAVYYSTHRVIPLIVAHMAVNAFAFCMALGDLF